MMKLKSDHNEMDKQKALFENERAKVYEELHKLQKKLEDEIRLRLFFESKLNSLHHINMDHDSRYKLLAEKHDKQSFDYSKLQVDHNRTVKEHNELTKFKNSAEQKIKEYEMRHKVDDESQNKGQDKLSQVV